MLNTTEQATLVNKHEQTLRNGIKDLKQISVDLSEIVNNEGRNVYTGDECRRAGRHLTESLSALQMALSYHIGVK